MSDGDRVHPSAAGGFQAAADAYDRGRPGYPPACVAYLSDRLQLRAERTVLDLGAGTGKLTALLVNTGAHVVAVEPVEAMRHRLATALPVVDTVAGVAEHLPLGDRALDAAVSAQAFHWFDPDLAFDELARTLRPGAPLALVWNVRDEGTAWVRRLSDIIEPHRGSTPAHRDQAWRPAALRAERFGPVMTTSFGYLHTTTTAGVVDRIASISFIAALPEQTRSAVLRKVVDVIGSSGAADGNDVVRFPYRTDVHVLERR